MSITRIITSTIAKGGSAKTTTAVHLAVASANQGYKTLLIDFDHQGQASRALGMDSQHGVYKYFSDGEPVISEARPNLDILSGSSRTKTVEMLAFTERWPMTRARIAGLTNPYDIVVIDTHPSGYMQEFAIAVAHTVVIPVALDFLTTEKVAVTIALVRALNGNADFCILPVMDDRTIESRTNRQQLTEENGTRVMASIPRRTAMRECPGFGETIFEYAPTNDAAIAYGEFADAILTNGNGETK